MTAPRTLLDKIWDAHVVADLGDGWSLIHVDRHLLHDLSGPPALMDLRRRGLPVRNPELTFATPDHIVSSRPGRVDDTFPPGARLVAGLRMLTAAAGIRLFDLGSEGQGIVHVIAPEMGLTLPGATQICGDSHTCTNGGLGALAFGVGTSESAHALATQTLRLRKPRNMRVRVEGVLGTGVTAKDLALHLLRTLGTTAGVEHNIEFAGSTVRALAVEERLTLCNLAVEMGARSALIAPDAIVFAYLRGRPFAPAGAAFDAAVAYWRTLASDKGAFFDKDIAIDAAAVVPTISWGTSPDQSMPIDGLIPGSEDAKSTSEDLAAALDYMGLASGEPIVGQPVDWVFIGSCANSRISDLRAAARVVEGRSVAPGVQAWVVPGSMAVRRAAETEGLDRLFTDGLPVARAGVQHVRRGEW